MHAARLSLPVLALLALSAVAARAQDEPVPSRCMAIAEALPKVTFASYANVQSTGDEDVTISYAGHSTYVIETPGGVRIATDFSGYNGADPLPDVVTMNKAHSSHYSLSPDPAITHILPGWGEEGEGPARHAVVVGDAYIRNVPTDIRRYGVMEEGGNSIFIFEIGDLCIGHLGHLHHRLEPEHYGAIGRLDIVMVPIDGGLTLSLDGMSEITTRLQSSIVLPMHRFSTPISEFAAMIGETFAVEYRDEPSFSVSLRTLPRQPTVLILDGV